MSPNDRRLLLKVAPWVIGFLYVLVFPMSPLTPLLTGAAVLVACWWGFGAAVRAIEKRRGTRP